MKLCNYLTLLCLVILFIQVNSNQIRTRHKNKEKGRTKIAHKSSFKKNGPIDWLRNGSISDVLSLEFGKNYNNSSTSIEITEPAQIKSNKNRLFDNKLTLTNDNNNYLEDLPTSAIYNEHFKSKTFKSVGPGIDSTVDQKGKKFSKTYKAYNKIYNSGYYGSSRLTR